MKGGGEQPSLRPAGPKDKRQGEQRGILFGRRRTPPERDVWYSSERRGPLLHRRLQALAAAVDPHSLLRDSRVQPGSLPQHDSGPGQAGLPSE